MAGSNFRDQGGLVIRSAPNDKKRADLATDIKGQVPARALSLTPIVVSRTAPAASGSLRIFEPGVGGEGTEDLSLSTGVTYLVPHPLKRPIFGRIVGWQSAAAHLFDVDPATLSPPYPPERYFAVKTSVGCVYRLVAY